MFVLQTFCNSNTVIIDDMKSICHLTPKIINSHFKLPEKDLPIIPIRSVEIKKKNQILGDVYSLLIRYFADKQKTFLKYVSPSYLNQEIVNLHLSVFGGSHVKIPKRFKNIESLKIAFDSCPTISNFYTIPIKYKNFELCCFAYSRNNSILDLVPPFMRPAVKNANLFSDVIAADSSSQTTSPQAESNSNEFNSNESNLILHDEILPLQEHPTLLFDPDNYYNPNKTESRFVSCFSPKFKLDIVMSPRKLAHGWFE
jgi:hypothetical protein